MARQRGLTTALKHRDYRYYIGAFTFSALGSWAYNVALTVWIYDQTGSLGYVTAATIGRYIPAMLFGTYAGVVADRFEKITVMRAVDVSCATIMMTLAALMVAGAPVALVIAVAAVSSTIATCYGPAAAGFTPQVVPAKDLASANALRNTIDNTTVILGPGIGAVLLLVGSAEAAVLVNGLSYVVSAVLISRVTFRSKVVDVTVGGTSGAVQQMLVGLKAMGSTPATAVMVGYSTLATFAFGVDMVLFVAVSEAKLGTGADGYGYLLVGLGIGGVLAGPLVTRADASPRVGLIILAGMVAFCLPTTVYLFTGSPLLACAAQVVRGAGTLFVDVLADTALQRTLPKEVISRVWGAMTTIVLLAVLLGSAFASACIAWFGLDATIWIAGVGFAGLSVLGLPWLLQIDRAAAVRRAALAPSVELLAECDIFEHVGDGDLHELADALEEISVPAGTAVVTEGDRPDNLYVVVEGVLSVTSTTTDVEIPDLHRGDYFGEIGLVERMARTATVTATTPTRLLRVPGEDFLEALTAYRPSVAMTEGSAMRLRRTRTSLEHYRLATEEVTP